MPATKEQAMQKERLFYKRMKVARPGRRTFDQ
jgi:hypothetical protein